jgi:hypothetical protein
MKRAAKYALAIAVLVSSAAAPAVAGLFEDGLDAQQRGDYATTIRLWRPLADQVDFVAQTNSGPGIRWLLQDDEVEQRTVAMEEMRKLVIGGLNGENGRDR